MREARAALRNGWNEIFNFQDLGVANPYTESISRLAKDANSMGRGYSVDGIRAKHLFDQVAGKPTTRVVRKLACKEEPEAKCHLAKVGNLMSHDAD